jgi:excisionase family DNA binding protein
VGSLEAVLGELLRRAVRDELARALPAIAQREASGGEAAAEYLTAAEAGDLARVREETVRRWVRGGDLPGHYAGRKLLVRRDELERYLARGKEPTRREADEERLGTLVREMRGLSE